METAVFFICPTLSGTKLVYFFEMGKFLGKNLIFAKFSCQKSGKYAKKHIFFTILFGSMKKKQYFCIVFFMVLDLRLSKDWVVVMTILLFLVGLKDKWLVVTINRI